MALFFRNKVSWRFFFVSAEKQNEILPTSRPEYFCMVLAFSLSSGSSRILIWSCVLQCQKNFSGLANPGHKNKQELLSSHFLRIVVCKILVSSCRHQCDSNNPTKPVNFVLQIFLNIIVFLTSWQQLLLQYLTQPKRLFEMVIEYN